MNALTILGLGRIGRHFLRELLDKYDNLYFCDLNSDFANICYLLNYDTVYGLRGERFIYDENKIIDTITGKEIQYVEMDSITNGVVIDCTGNLTCLEKLKKLNLKVYTTHTPSKEYIDSYLISGVEENASGNVLSTSICDTTAIAPILKYLDDKYSVDKAHVTTLHPWLNYQNLSDNSVISTDAPSHYYNDYALGRKSTEALIPKTTSAISAFGMVFPNLASKLRSWSFRVPTPVVSSALLNVDLKSEFSFDSFIEDMERISAIGISKDNLISTDYIGAEYNCIIDKASISFDGKSLYMGLWYDNELGYVKQVLKMIERIEKW